MKLFYFEIVFHILIDAYLAGILSIVRHELIVQK